MKIKALYYYPVKSLAGVATTELSLDRFGPVGDRRWMLVDQENRFVTQRKNPSLVRIRPRLNDEGLCLDIPGQGRVKVRASNDSETVTVWRDQVDGVLMASPEASEAVSVFLGKPVTLVYMPDSVTRPVRQQSLQAVHPVSFADGFPLLVTSQASLEDLNQRLPWSADMRRFRPNVVVEGAAMPWEEDRWQTLALGDVPVRLVKPCSRCVMTTVDPDSGERSPDGNPLKTLSGFRRTEDGVIFGANGVHLETGTLRVEDPVTIKL
ncbi:MOSC domain-containing protein [Marinobacter zhanjiangensis]|uniref:MOSC domain-containing protein n=1 Tax=Marinobacter zhanjiangensis TaxID=578215 RepID=A0ABQ3AWM7_9GAMM|nr:MOSC N-terminal beta barrel domain-containing protein [Marinobacter zhanjiangensis]GGY66578.1 MOSC domain-containing protein [Marinobacter zhanjiangensis]